MIFLAKLGIGVLGSAVVAGAALSSEGFIHVRVHEKRRGGDNVFVIVPAAVVPIAAHFVPRENLREASENIRPYLPVIDAAIPALEDCPDGVFVEVTDSDEHVLVSKSGGSLVVDVNDHDETVHVSLPLRAAQSTIHQIAEAEPPNLSH
jgi:hypothetical protein